MLIHSYFCTSLQSQALTGGGSGNPEQQYASQLDQLSAMGFINREANLQGMYVFFIIILKYLIPHLSLIYIKVNVVGAWHKVKLMIYFSFQLLLPLLETSTLQ